MTGKKATLILSSASQFGTGAPFESANVVASYLKQILGFIRITKVTVILAGERCRWTRAN